ncbi:hypothetical protein [Actinacidiphila yeochonensis]|uniref:hypothetical protein n=1 Tax=Actinacidiphila yeochonensis TaxID=89050 RepID=UPI00055D7BF3|nr:hypothetical protein [Actinacidiphila yeochonensis]
MESEQQDTVAAPFRRGRRALALVAAVAVAVGLAATAATGGLSRSQDGVRPPSATPLLMDTADAAAAQPDGEESYWVDTDHGAFSISRDMRLTHLGDGSNPQRQVGFPGWRLGTRVLDWNGLARLTSDPEALLRITATTRRGGHGEDAGTTAFEDAAALLAEAPTSQRQRAGLVAALSQMKGVKVAGTVKDATGRSGTELTHQGTVGTTELIIDPRTSTLLEIDKPWAGTVNDRRTTILSSGLAETFG